MNSALKLLSWYLPATFLVSSTQFAVGQAANDEARITRVIRDVKLVPPESDPTPAKLEDTVKNDTAVRTGEESRTELTFADLTITRLGENTIFTFNRAGRNVQLNNGSILLYVPKDSGGAKLATTAVSVAITGTTIIFEADQVNRTQLSVLEGGAFAKLVKDPRETVYVRGGEMIDVPPGATKMPKPVKFNLKKILQSPLIADFPPLPSESLFAGGGKSKPVHRSKPISQPAGNQPTGPQPVYVPPGPAGPPIVYTPGRPGRPRPKKPPRPKGGKSPTATPTPSPGNPGGVNPGQSGPKGGYNQPGRPKKPVKRPRGKPTPTPKPIP